MPPAESHGIRLVRHPRKASETAPILLVLLPGFDIHAEDFASHGFVAALEAQDQPVDVIIAEPALDFYLDGTIAQRLTAMLAAEVARCDRRLWLGGISLGGFGALLVAAGGRIPVEGLLLLAPFLGVPGLIAEIARAGGLANWQPGLIAGNDGERRVCAWLKNYAAIQPPRPRLHLGYGRDDRFAPASRLLAAGQPAARCHIEEGGHDWPTWERLWARILDARPFREA